MPQPRAKDAKGYLAILLHAHMPFVFQSEKPYTLEERWLFEAITECYLPLLQNINRLSDEKIDFSLTISLSPPLMEMLANPTVQERYSSYLDRTLKLAVRETERVKGSQDEQRVAAFYLKRLEDINKIYHQKYGGNLLEGFRQATFSGDMELITSSATHAYLPLLLTQEARKAQVQLGVKTFTRHFGYKPRGFWLPECAFTPGLEVCLEECGLEYFLVDSHGLNHATPHPPAGVYNPIRLKGSRLAAFGRDPETTRQVWSRTDGYPGDPDYREFYRDIGHDLEWEYLRPHLPEGIRLDTGFKYHRITGPGLEKQIYNPDRAKERAADHARHFLINRTKQVEYLLSTGIHLPVVVSPYDAELFGHWWFEGPDWLEQVFRQLAEMGKEKNNAQSGNGASLLRPVTLGSYLDIHQPRHQAELHLSSWGEEGYSKVWLNPKNDFLYRHLHRAESQLLHVVSGTGREETAPYSNGNISGDHENRIIQQMARELLLAQASDWAFMLNSGNGISFVLRQVARHLHNFQRLHQWLDESAFPVDRLRKMEKSAPVFPDLEVNIFNQRNGSVQFQPTRRQTEQHSTGGQKPLRVLMLTWEFPPRLIGGIAPHVAELSAALVDLNVEVTVLTLGEEKFPTESFESGIRIFRLPLPAIHGQQFRDWVFEFNLRMLDFMETNFASNPSSFDLAHAHDWLVYHAASQVAKSLEIPLVTTIHATEYGRNRGLHTPEQQAIHLVEDALVGASRLIICCSRFMAEEIAGLFPEAGNKLVVIPNGVAFSPEPKKCPISLVNFPLRKHVILFVGRLVPEKGVQTLLQAAPAILAQEPETIFIIAGRGPFADQLQQLASELGLEEQVIFCGFVSPAERNWLLQLASVAVFPSFYEPFGIVALEAMVAGTPVIVANTGGLAEVVTSGVDGITFEPGNTAALADSLLVLLRDKNLAHTLSRHARQRVEQDFDWKDIAQTTKNAYLSLVITGAGQQLA